MYVHKPFIQDGCEVLGLLIETGIFRGVNVEVKLVSGTKGKFLLFDRAVVGKLATSHAQY